PGWSRGGESPVSSPGRPVSSGQAGTISGAELGDFVERWIVMTLDNSSRGSRSGKSREVRRGLRWGSPIMMKLSTVAWLLVSAAALACRPDVSRAEREGNQGSEGPANGLADRAEGVHALPGPPDATLL